MPCSQKLQRHGIQRFQITIIFTATPLLCRSNSYPPKLLQQNDFMLRQPPIVQEKQQILDPSLFTNVWYSTAAMTDSTKSCFCLQHVKNRHRLFLQILHWQEICTPAISLLFLLSDSEHPSALHLLCLEPHFHPSDEHHRSQGMPSA